MTAQKLGSRVSVRGWVRVYATFGLDKLVDIMGLCFSQNDDWVAAGRNAVINAEQPAGGHIDENQVSLRKAFDAARLTRFDIAVTHIQAAVNATQDSQLKGYLKQRLAEYTNFTDPAAAQELQLAALTVNHRLLKPLAGATYHRLNAPASGQAVAAVDFMSRFLEGNDLIIWVNGLLDDLDWGEDGSNRFEAAMKDLGLFLGFGSDRPEDLVGRGPDNLWALGSQRYLVIECKSGAVLADRVCKHDTNQLNGSIVWFEQKYDATCTMTPILVHPKTVFEYAASPDGRIRIINEAGLTRLRDALRAYSVALASKSGFTDSKEVQRQQQFHKLGADQIVDLCTVSQGSK